MTINGTLLFVLRWASIPKVINDRVLKYRYPSDIRWTAMQVIIFKHLLNGLRLILSYKMIVVKWCRSEMHLPLAYKIGHRRCDMTAVSLCIIYE